MYIQTKSSSIHQSTDAITVKLSASVYTSSVCASLYLHK